VDYTVIIDFSVFEKAIDIAGGLDITVDRSFTDFKYPVAGRESDPCESCRYQTVNFSAGSQRMDGATALKYVRSRNAEGDEGTDFARSARQEKLISAFKQKVLSSPTKLFQLKNVVLNGIVTDITPDLHFPLVKLALKSSRTKLRTAAITEPLVYNPSISSAQDYQWVLLPQDDNFSSLASYVKNLLTLPIK
ncbi:MAG: LCP family protein, partial [Patescibacteria group bacterium]